MDCWAECSGSNCESCTNGDDGAWHVVRPSVRSAAAGVAEWRCPRCATAHQASSVKVDAHFEDVQPPNAPHPRREAGPAPSAAPACRSSFPTYAGDDAAWSQRLAPFFDAASAAWRRNKVVAYDADGASGIRYKTPREQRLWDRRSAA